MRSGYSASCRFAGEASVSSERRFPQALNPELPSRAFVRDTGYSLERDHGRHFPSSRGRHRRFHRHRIRACQVLRRENGFDLIVAADEPAIEPAAQAFRWVLPSTLLEADLATPEGVDKLYAARPWASSSSAAGQRRARPGQGVSRSGFRRRDGCRQHQHHRHHLSHPKGRP